MPGRQWRQALAAPPDTGRIVAIWRTDWLARHVFVGIGERTDTGNRLRYFKLL
jgi:hypothetical protein